MQPYEGWTILELMGHRKLAGWVSEVEVAGGKMLRIDVPDRGMEITTAMSDHEKPLSPWSATQFYNSSALYCMTPTTAEIAIKFARGCQPEPVSRWDLKEPAKAILAASDDGDDEDRPY